MPRFFSVLLSASILTSINAAITNLTSTNCADASAFTSCQNNVIKATAKCLDAAEGDLEVEACGCIDYVYQMNCYAANCWNRAYECEYQLWVAEYLAGCATAALPVPYFPAPVSALDTCSCNLGLLYEAINGTISQTAVCDNAAANLDFTNLDEGLEELAACNCCELSGAYSSYANICPDTDPSLLGYSKIASLAALSDTDFSECDPYMTKLPCSSSLNFSTSLIGGPYYASSALPPTGTGTLSNLQGTVTAPASGAVFTWTDVGGGGVAYTITANGLKGGSGGGGGISTTVAGGSGGSSTATGSAGSASTTKPSAGSAMNINWVGVWGLTLCTLLFVS